MLLMSAFACYHISAEAHAAEAKRPPRLRFACRRVAPVFLLEQNADTSKKTATANSMEYAPYAREGMRHYAVCHLLLMLNTATHA